ncbi:uncharacterized protein LOC127242076 [Andrographis paniculata]|uniref:uncharacterized protein LOC127242076 n=1 Tax=Andrographis paniculata TaxID=175694 RepID=UPI0021E8E284|nr:uncharacterized protein LOC127242076 [Andrographis paniculata]
MTDFSFLVWNVRGAGNSRAQREIHYLCCEHRVRILLLLEPMVEAALEYFCRRLGFAQMIRNEANTIWLFVDSSFHIQMLASDDQWIYVQLSSPQIRRPFLLTGVYGRYISEREGPGRPRLRSIQDFSGALLDAGLVDAGFEGPQLTWTNRRVWKRLDQILYSRFWEEFAESTRSIWICHHSFLDRVRESWEVPTWVSGLLSLRLKLGRLERILRWWNRHVFGDVFHILAEAERKAAECEAEYDRDPSESTLLHRQRSAAALTHAIALEEALWRQKAACRWAVDGERNSRMFHSMVRECRRCASIFYIRDGERELTEHSDIKASAVSYFASMFREPDDVDTSGMDELADMPPQVPPEENQRLLAPPMACWEIVGPDVLAAVLDFFSGTLLPKFYTATTIVLIPKKDAPESWADYRPISLCNVSNKIITKLLTVRLGTLLPRLLSPHQSGFVKGHAIADNILMASEMVHDLNLRGTSHNLLLKLDLNKAYDRVSWRFLRHALLRFGFAKAFITLVMHCIEHAYYSPNLFVLAADLLSRGLERLYQRLPDLYFRCRGGFRLSHLAYADDVLIFVSACGEQMSSLTTFLADYARITGQKVNCQKSSIVFSRRCLEEVREQLQSVTGFRVADLPLTYLGAPLYVGNQRRILYEELLGKLRRYLSRWDRAVLSHGSRLQLIRSIFLSLPLYLLQVLHPPQSILHEVEQICAHFFWGSYHGHRQRHWISCVDAARPQDEDGLGVRRLSDMVRAFSMKLWWKLREGSSLWAQAMRHKYFRDSFPGRAPCRIYDSPVWKRLCCVREEVQSQIYWTLGRGECFFWEDRWFGEQPLSTFRGDSRPPPTILVRDMWTEGSWDVGRLRAYLLEALVQRVIEIPFDRQTEDRMS